MIWRQHIHKVVLRLPDSWSNCNLEVLVFEERGKPEYPGKNLSQQRRGQTTNSTNILRRRRDLNSGHIGGRRALSPLRHLGPPQLFAQIISYLSRQIVENCVQSLYINLTPLSMYQIKGKYIENKPLCKRHGTRIQLLLEF